MPIVTVKMLEGRNDDQKRALIEQVTSAIVETVDAPAENVTVIIEEMKHENYGNAGKRPSILD
ncbi:2-hydroxymuconate tautomerase [Alkalicoccobacillus murimartini]|uniref:Tautomerase n=1 Tax=Alkalicoccobacillus murimartini TaxID=171685 RepID=A0ABT9YHK3_9BACI|nr:2-hydroxymuconate tautomerase [Alkalicoccobacillus murimartini]MDQ0207088.1 4-oxalocrotonate tautomerase [Alkalicoccobacillus murimartini]